MRSFSLTETGRAGFDAAPWSAWKGFQVKMDTPEIRKRTLAPSQIRGMFMKRVKTASDQPAANRATIAEANPALMAPSSGGPPAWVRLGDRNVDAYDIGTLPLGVTYPDRAKRPSREEAVRIIHAALDCGAEFIDVADAYSEDQQDFGYVEGLASEAVRTHASAGLAVIATKGGMRRLSSESNGWRPSSCDFDTIYSAIRASWTALGSSAPIFLWQLHHPNDKVTPIEESMRAAKRAQDEGLVQHIGVCNVDLAQLRRAADTVRIASVQGKLNMWDRGKKSSPDQNGVLDWCTANSVPFIAHGALGGLEVGCCCPNPTSPFLCHGVAAH